MKKSEEEKKHIQAFESTEERTAPSKVSDLVKTLEKSLNPSHFLNTRFNTQNIKLCEQLMAKRKEKSIESLQKSSHITPGQTPNDANQ
ncbi:hypothetical protein NEIRO03_0175 [Nematocida sp. AWRm78]|nr:hypothetical protein NEIRO02_0175 [Nematocida sp. AWRm79]KAI5182511.1 hypothetical protein NEIRO03_0175 [Nematocida sp. AWRm78]